MVVIDTLSIEDITLTFSVHDQIQEYPHPLKHVHIMQWLIILSGDSKKCAATTNTHRTRLIQLLKERKLLASSLSTICDNTYVCAEKYRCASVL